VSAAPAVVVNYKPTASGVETSNKFDALSDAPAAAAGAVKPSSVPKSPVAMVSDR